MASLPVASNPALAPAATPEDLARAHWRERLMRGYLAVKSLCLRCDLPVEGEFFDGCVDEFACAYRLASKGTRALNVDILSAVVVYRQSRLAGIPVPKSGLIKFLGGTKVMGAFHRVLASTTRHATRRDLSAAGNLNPPK